MSGNSTSTDSARSGGGGSGQPSTSLYSGNAPATGNGASGQSQQPQSVLSDILSTGGAQPSDSTNRSVAIENPRTINPILQRMYMRMKVLLFPGPPDVPEQKLDHLAVYLNNAEARDKICRAIQYGSKFISGGRDGVANQVDISTALARKVFRLLKSVNEVLQLGETLGSQKSSPRMLIGSSQHTFMAIYFALDNLVWAGKVGIYKNQRHTEVLSNIALYFFLFGSGSGVLSELNELISHRHEPEEKKKLRAKALGIVRSSMDVVVAIGLLRLAPKWATPRVTGAFGFLSSLITCYELFVSLEHLKNKEKHN